MRRRIGIGDGERIPRRLIIELSNSSYTLKRMNLNHSYSSAFQRPAKASFPQMFYTATLHALSQGIALSCE